MSCCCASVRLQTSSYVHRKQKPRLVHCWRELKKVWPMIKMSLQHPSTTLGDITEIKREFKTGPAKKNSSVKSTIGVTGRFCLYLLDVGQRLLTNDGRGGVSGFFTIYTSPLLEDLLSRADVIEYSSPRDLQGNMHPVPFQGCVGSFFQSISTIPNMAVLIGPVLETIITKIKCI